MKGYWILKGIKFAVLGAAMVALVGLAVMGLWNWLMPAVFGLGVITWCQALGLLLLARILVGGRGWGGGGRCCHGGGGRGGHWRAKWEAKWEKMSPEERSRFREQYGNKCGTGKMGRGPWADKTAENQSEGSSTETQA